MTCDFVQPLLSAYVDRQLLASEKVDVSQHLASCKVCQKEVRSLIQIKQILRVSPQPEMPADLPFRIERQTVFSRSFENGGTTLRWLIPSLAFAIAGAWSLIHFYSGRNPLIHPQILEAHAPAPLPHHETLAWHSTAPFTSDTQ